MGIRLEKFGISTMILLFAVLMGSIITSCSFFAEHSMSMPHAIDTAMHIDGETVACCQMTSHHNPFQNIVADVVNKPLSAYSHFISVLGLALLFMGFWLLADKTLPSYLYRMRRILSMTSNYLVQALSQGILQPQIYNA